MGAAGTAAVEATEKAEADQKQADAELEKQLAACATTADTAWSSYVAALESNEAAAQASWTNHCQKVTGKVASIDSGHRMEPITTPLQLTGELVAITATANAVRPSTCWGQLRQRAHALGLWVFANRGTAGGPAYCRLAISFLLRVCFKPLLVFTSCWRLLHLSWAVLRRCCVLHGFTRLL